MHEKRPVVLGNKVLIYFQWNRRFYLKCMRVLRIKHFGPSNQTKCENILSVSLLLSASAALMTMERVSGQQELSPEGIKVFTLSVSHMLIFLSLSFHYLSIIEPQSCLSFSFLLPSGSVCFVILYIDELYVVKYNINIIDVVYIIIALS